MPLLREWIHRLLGTLRRGRRDRDLEDELRLHVEMATEEAHRRGEPMRAASRTAQIRVGSALQAMDALRDQRGLPWLDELTRDVRHGVRALRRTPSFTAVALLTLALGIGANAAIYQLLDAIRIRTLAVKAPEQLAIVELADTTRWVGRRASGYPVLSNPLWEHFRDHQNIFSGVLAWANTELQLDRGLGPRVARGLLVSGDFFSVLGVEAHTGRTFTAADDRPGCGVPGAVVSYGFWQRYLGGDPAAVGRTLALNSRSVEVIGVTAPGFSGVEVGRAFDVAVPICSQAALGGEAGWLGNGTVWWLTVMGRMPADRSLDSVNTQLDSASPGLFEASLPANYPPNLVKDYLGFRLRATPGATGVSGLRRRYADPLLLLQLTTALVLFIACTNLASLVFARASTRAREFAVRLAVGGSWVRLVRQLMVENALIAIGGAVAGLACATVLSRSLVGMLGSELSLELPLDLRLMAFMLGIASLACLTFGLIPAWRASRVSAVDVMKATVRGSSGSRGATGLRRALVIAQVACSLVLLFGGLLFTATLRNLLAVDLGFETRNVAVARIDLSSLSIPQSNRAAFTANVLERIRQIPGVISAAEVRHVPLGGTANSMTVEPDAAGGTTEASTVRINAASAGYLKTMGIPLIAGRDFMAADSRQAPRVAIVNRTFARQLGLKGTIVGQRFRRQSGPTYDVYEIVGQVPDSKFFTLREEALPIALLPIAQIVDPRPFTDVMIRSAARPEAIAAALSGAVADVSPLIGADVRPFDSTIRTSVLPERLMATLSGLFAGLAALIAMIGLYGVMSYLVLRQTNEIGVRMALGARRPDILRMVLGEAGRLLAVGLAIGVVASLAAAGAARALVFGLQPHDLGIVGLACVLLGATAMGASWLPAHRAATLPPLTALREQ
jgi:predicted permease